MSQRTRPRASYARRPRDRARVVDAVRHAVVRARPRAGGRRFPGVARRRRPVVDVLRVVALHDDGLGHVRVAGVRLHGDLVDVPAGRHRPRPARSSSRAHFRSAPSAPTGSRDHSHRRPRPPSSPRSAYAVNPVARNTLAEGQLGPLVLFALAPWILGAIVRAGVRDTDRPRASPPGAHGHVAGRRRHCGLATGIALPAGRCRGFRAGRAVRRRLAASRAHVLDRRYRHERAAFVLCTPWALSLFGADAATLGVLSAPPRHSVTCCRSIPVARTRAPHPRPPHRGCAAAGRRPRLAPGVGGAVVDARRRVVRVAWLPGRLDHATHRAEGVLVPAASGSRSRPGSASPRSSKTRGSSTSACGRSRRLSRRSASCSRSLGFVVDTWQGRWDAPGTDWPARLGWIERTNPNRAASGCCGSATRRSSRSTPRSWTASAPRLTRDGTGDIRAEWSAPSTTPTKSSPMRSR